MNEDELNTDIKKFKEWNEVSTQKKIFAIILLLLIFALGIYICINKDKYFITTEVLTFPDGCNETYTNGINYGSNCTLGRQLLEEQTKNVYRVGKEMNVDKLIVNNT